MSYEVPQSIDPNLLIEMELAEAGEFNARELVRHRFNHELGQTGELYIDYLLHHTRPSWISADRSFKPHIVETRVRLSRQLKLGGFDFQSYNLNPVETSEQAGKDPYTIWVREHPLSRADTVEEAKSRMGEHEMHCPISEVSAWYLLNARKLKGAVIVSSTRYDINGEEGYLSISKLWRPIREIFNPSRPKLVTVKDGARLPRQAVLLSRLK